MDNKFLNSDSTSISYEELLACAKDLIRSEEFETLKSVFQNHRFVIFELDEKLRTSLQLFYDILNGIGKSAKDLSAVSPYFINLTGLLCAKLNLEKESLYLYLLALLSGERKEIALYYNNVGSALANLDDYKLANTFYTKGLKFIGPYLENNIKGAATFLNFTKLNQGVSCILDGDYETAVANFNKVDLDHLEQVDDLYILLKSFLKLYELNSDAEAAKDLIESIEEKHDVFKVNLRCYVIKHYDLSTLEQYNLLKENLNQLRMLQNVNKKRIDCLTQLIVHAQELNNKEEEFVFLKLLFEENLYENNYETLASQIIVEQYVVFFNKLTKINVRIKYQKDELQKLTYILSHNLKTPIRSIYGFSQLLTNRHSSTLNPEAKEYLDFIDNGCNELYDLLNNILHITNYNNKKELETPVSLSQIIDQIKRELSVSSEKEVKIIQNNILPTIWARKSDIKELFGILIENGVKFNNSEVAIINFKCTLELERLILTVTDNGIGIDSFGRNKIFDLFTTLEDKSRYSGTGFGLGMAKKILEYYNGEIFLKQTGSEGSVFRIELPHNLIISELETPST